MRVEPKSIVPITFQTVSDAYLEVLAAVMDRPQYECAPRGLRIKEILEVSFSVAQPSDQPIVTLDSDRNKVIASYTAKEFALYESGSNHGDDFAAAAKFWDGLRNPDGTINSAYGKLVFKDRSHGNPDYEAPSAAATFAQAVALPTAGGPSPDDFDAACAAMDDVMRTPWDWAKYCLITDRDTRQAIFHINLPEHAWKGTKDYPCTLYGQFFIRDNRLLLTIGMRSNDCVRGLVYDMPWFCYLLLRMRTELLETYPELLVGSYVHRAGSMHVYESDWEMARKMLGRS